MEVRAFLLPLSPLEVFPIEKLVLTASVDYGILVSRARLLRGYFGKLDGIGKRILIGKEF